LLPDSTQAELIISGHNERGDPAFFVRSGEPEPRAYSFG
jgi:hypothetical protein